MGARRQDLHALFTYVQHTYAEARTPSLAAPGSTILKPIAGCSPRSTARRASSRKAPPICKGRRAGGNFWIIAKRSNRRCTSNFWPISLQLDMQRLWKAFPLPTYSAQAPIQAFYDWYHVEAQPH